MDRKEQSGSLKVRLDTLETDLQVLHATLGQIKAPVVLSPKTFSVSHSQVVKIKRPLPKRGHSKDSNRNNDQMVDQLKSINKSLNKGSLAVQKIASLTELSTFSTLSWSPFVQRPVEENALTFLPKGSLSETSLATQSTKAHKELVKERAAKIDLQVENEVLKGKLDQVKKENTQASQVKKRFKEEKLRREAAEALAAEYKMEVCRLTENPHKKEMAALQEEVKKRSEEAQMCKRTLDNMEENLEAYKRQVDDLLESKRATLAMVEEYRDRYERIYATKNSTAACLRGLQEKNIGLTRKVRDLEKDQVFLQNELSRVRNDQKEKDSECQRELQSLIEHFKDRAEKAERDLLNKFKECNELKLRSPFSDPEVIDIMDKQAKAICDLTNELKNKETEMATKIEALEKEMNEAGDRSDTKMRELNTKLKEMDLKVGEKEESLLESQRLQILMEKDLNELHSRLSESTSTTKHQEALIKSLNETLAANSSHFGTLSSEIGHLKKDNERLQEELKALRMEQQTKQSVLSNAQKQVEMEMDKVKVKDKMLTDQVETIKALRATLNETRAVVGEERATIEKLSLQIQKVEMQKRDLQQLNEELQSSLEETLHQRKETDKHNHLLKQLENQVYEKRNEWERQLKEMCREKDQAVQTAKFATQKLLEAVNNYESQIIHHKKVNKTLSCALQEKELQLQTANQQMEELNTEVWKSAKISQQVRDSLNNKTRRQTEMVGGDIKGGGEFQVL